MGSGASASLELRVGNESLDITPFVSRFSWVESMIAGGFAWSLRFTASQWKEWNDLMMGRDRSTFQLRLRSEEEDGTQSTEWRTAITDKSRVSFGQDTSMVAEVKGADRRLLMAQKSRTRTFEANTVSQIISKIALEYNLTSRVEVSTARRSEWTQARMDDWSFLRGIASDASTESGRGDSYLWLDERTLHFGAPELGAASDRRYDLSVIENRVEDYVGTYHGREADRDGAATLRGIGFDFATKKAVAFTMNPNTAQAHASLAARVPRKMGDGLRTFPVFEDTSDRVQEVVRSRWGRVAPRYMAVRMNTRPDLTVRPNTIISIESNMDNSRETPFMGRYVAVEIQHVMENGAVTTSLIGYRREAQEGDAQPTGANADTSQTRDRSQRAGIMPRTVVTAQRVQ